MRTLIDQSCSESMFILNLLVAIAISFILIPAFGQEEIEDRALEEARPSQQESCPGVDAEAFKAGKEAMDRTIAALTKGLEVDRGDYRRMIALGNACKIGAIRQVAETGTQAVRRVRRDLRVRVAEISTRALAQYNNAGGDPTAWPLDKDRKALEAFRLALLAANALDKLSSPQQLQLLDAQVTTKARDVAQRVLAEFNQSDGHATFSEQDERVLQDFRKAVEGRKKEKSN
jgi:hypothetical protein